MYKYRYNEKLRKPHRCQNIEYYKVPHIVIDLGCGNMHSTIFWYSKGFIVFVN